MTSAREPHDTQSGFTLLELLVALALLALLSTLLLSVITTTQGAVATINMWSTDRNAVPQIRQFLEVIGKARRVGNLTSQGGGDTSLRGNKTSLRFVANSRRPGHVAGLYEFRLQARPGRDPGRQDLTLELSLVRPNAEGTSVQSHVLLTGIQGLSFRYFGVGPNGERAWFTRWNSKQSHPELVSIDIGFTDRKTRWTPLVVRLEML